MKTRRLINYALLMAATTAISCAEQPAPRATKSYKTIITALGQSSVNSTYTTAIKGEQYVDIQPQISGVITDILINEGANISKGQSLFIIDQTPYQAALDVAIANVKSAEANVATARLNAVSGEELFEAEIISQNEYQTTLNTLASSEAALTLAEAQETIARNDLSYTVIKSPVDGVAAMIDYNVGAYVTSSDILVRVTNSNMMYAYFSMPEARIITLTRQYGSTKALMEGMPEVELILKDGSLYDEKGRVNAISGTVDQSTGTVGIRAIFENPDQMLRDGGSGRISITTQYDNVIVVPQVATFEVQEKKFVYKVVDGKAVSAQIIVLPIDNGRDYIVESGIDVGVEIIAEGAGLLREGTVVSSK